MTVGYETDDGHQLGRWVSHQRNFARNKVLSQQRIEHLRDIRFDFDPYNSQWLEQFENLSEYFSFTKHSNVPSRYQNRELARWVVKQRVAFRSNTLEDWKKEKLEAVNFEFKRRNENGAIKNIFPMARLNCSYGAWDCPLSMNICRGRGGSFRNTVTFIKICHVHRDKCIVGAVGGIGINFWE